MLTDEGYSFPQQVHRCARPARVKLWFKQCQPVTLA